MRQTFLDTCARIFPMPQEKRHEKRKDRATRLELHAIERIASALERLNEFLREVKSFTIRGDNHMGALVIVIGTTRTFDLVDIPSNAVLPPGVIPAWATDDPTNTSLSPSTDGLKCAVAAANDPTLVGKTFNLTVSAALPDGTNPTSGPTPVAYAAAAAVEPTSFSIAEEPAS